MIALRKIPGSHDMKVFWLVYLISVLGAALLIGPYDRSQGGIVGWTVGVAVTTMGGIVGSLTRRTKLVWLFTVVGGLLIGVVQLLAGVSVAFTLGIATPSFLLGVAFSSMANSRTTEISFGVTLAALATTVWPRLGEYLLRYLLR